MYLSNDVGLGVGIGIIAVSLLIKLSFAPC